MISQRLRTRTVFIRAARRRQSFIIVTALVFVIAAGFSLKRMPSIYESRVFIAIESASTADPSRRAYVLQQQGSNRDWLEGLITNHELFKQEIEKGTRLDDLTSQMRAGITVNVDSNGARETGSLDLASAS